MTGASSVQVLIQRDRLWIALGLFTVIALAWVYLVREAADLDASAAAARMRAAMGMGGISMGTRDVSVWLALFGMWTVMVVGMMLPSAAPVTMLVLGAYRLRNDSRTRLASLAFLGGYLVVWTGFSAVAALGHLELHHAALLSDDMRLHSAIIAGVLLEVSGIYQWLPIKEHCLAHCQAPLAFFTRHWRPGISGGFRMGLHHGAFCLGCCWLLMTLLFVLGVMNLFWIIALGAIVLLEKLSPYGLIAGRAAGLAAAGWGVYLLVGQY
jgi:predicted metal-binding membrane protein